MNARAAQGKSCKATCTVPPGAGLQLAVEVKVQTEASWAAPGSTLSYLPPSVASIEPAGGAVGTTLTIRGQNLGTVSSAEEGGVRVFVGGVRAERLLMVDEQETLSVDVPPSLATGTHEVLVMRGEQRSAPDDARALPAPEAIFEVCPHS